MQRIIKLDYAPPKEDCQCGVCGAQLNEGLKAFRVKYSENKKFMQTYYCTTCDLDAINYYRKYGELL